MFCTLLRPWNQFHKANLFWKYYGLRDETITGADDYVESPLRGINYCYSTFRPSTWATYVALCFLLKAQKGGGAAHVWGFRLPSSLQGVIKIFRGAGLYSAVYWRKWVQLFRIKSSQWNKQTMPSNSKLALPFIRMILVDLLLFIANI